MNRPLHRINRRGIQAIFAVSLRRSAHAALILLATAELARAEPPVVVPFLETHCLDCHNAESKKGNLDISTLKLDSTDSEDFRRWVKIHDRIESGEMPPKSEERPPTADAAKVVGYLKETLAKADRDRRQPGPRAGLRRLTRAEYENTVRDLLDTPGIALQNDLPADGSAHGFDKNDAALDISHVNLAKYIEAADHALDVAIATRPTAPPSSLQRISLANTYIVGHVLLHGDALLLKDKKPDPAFPFAAEHIHIDQGAHEAIGSFHTDASVGLFRHEDESFTPYFNDFVAIFPARYRIKTSLWSFQWDKGAVLPSRGTEAVRISIVQLTGDGRGGGHPSSTLAYLDAPSINSRVHELETWMNTDETLGFNAASLVGGYNRGEKHLLAFTGPGVACDWLTVEGPFYDSWPPKSHKVLFGDLPIVEFKPEKNPNVRIPKHEVAYQRMMGKNRGESVPGVWTVQSEKPLEDADRLLAAFLPKAFRRPVPADVRKAYVDQVDKRLRAGDCFEVAMRWAFRAALCSPDFLYHVEGESTDGDRSLDDFALASRLSYFLRNSMPDDRLIELAANGSLHKPEVLRGEVERLRQDPKSERFIDDFLGQWLKLRQIAANDPDNKLYPEFRPYLQDAMVAETRAYFRELIDKDLDASYLVKSDFAMLNEKLATHYGIPGVSGTQIRRVQLPPDSPRGGFLTQAAILKITANGTTTSPVPRGAFVMDRIFGKPPEPPPANIAAVEPDVRGTTTIREQLAKHRDQATCASCHAKIDPPGFALESFDVIGGWRDRYRSIGKGDPAPRGTIDPAIGISFLLGPPVDPSGTLPDGQAFHDIREFQTLVAADSTPLLKNLAERFATYAIGREMTFSDRDDLAAIVAATKAKGGGIRTLIHELIQSPLFRTL